LAKADIEVSQSYLVTLPPSLPFAEVKDVLDDTQEVNNMWRGLGYYRRAKNLLLGSQRIMNDPKRYQGERIYDDHGQTSDTSPSVLACRRAGRLPDDPVKLEKDVEGVGRYTAGAICSMAYGVKTPIVSWV
jgi:A/G-specific adenine glycosylase